MNREAVAANLQCIERARTTGDLHEVHGRQYPVPLGEFERWQEEQKRLFIARARSHGARFGWRAIFRRTAAA